MQKLALILAALIISIITTAQEIPVKENQDVIVIKAASATNLQSRHFNVIFHSKEYRAKSYENQMAWMLHGTTQQKGDFPKIDWIGVERIGKGNIDMDSFIRACPFSTFC